MFANVERRVDVDLYEAGDPAPDFIPHRAIRRDRRNNYDDAVSRKQLGNETNSPDVFIPILHAKTEIFAQTLPNDIAIEHFHLTASRAHAIEQLLSDSAFSGG